MRTYINCLGTISGSRCCDLRVKDEHHVKRILKSRGKRQPVDKIEFFPFGMIECLPPFADTQRTVQGPFSPLS